MTKYKVIVIGLGKIGLKYGLDLKRTQPASHIAAVIDNPNLELMAVCDPNKENIELFIKKYGNKTSIFENFKDLVENINCGKIDFDIIVLSTPDQTHSELLTYLIENLKEMKERSIVFCEKPLALSYEIAKKIQLLEKTSKINIVINHSRRWSKIWKESYELTKQIGEIQKASFYFSTSPENKEISQIRDGIHIADLMAWFGIEEKTTITRLPLPYFVYDLHIWGSKGKIEVLGWGKTLNFFEVEDSPRFEGFKELKLIYTKEIKESYMVNTYEEFVEYLNGTRNSLATNLNDAVEALRVFEKYVYDDKSLKTGNERSIVN